MFSVSKKQRMLGAMVLLTMCSHHPHKISSLCEAFSTPSPIYTNSYQKSKKAYKNDSFTQLNAWGQKGSKSQDREPLKSEISDKRRKQLGIADDEREYDLGVALATNTDPLITKIIAGSFVIVVIALLIAGIVVPSLTDYGEGVCNPILTAGRC